MPDKLKQMKDIFYAEEKKNDVLPLDNATLARWNTPRPSLTAGRTVFPYSGVLTGAPASGAPSILNKSYTINAEVEIPAGGAEGMIVTEGGRFGGYGLFLSGSFNWWSPEWFFRRIALAAFVLGLLLIWLGRFRRWLGWMLRLGYGVS